MRVNGYSPDLSLPTMESLATPLLELGDVHIHRSLLRRDMLVQVLASLFAHEEGKWGEIDSVDRQANIWALEQGGKIVSRWRMLRPGDPSFWIVTNAARTQTTVFPDLKEK